MKTKYILPAFLLAISFGACRRPNNPTPPEDQSHSAKDSVTASDTMRNMQQDQATILNDFATNAAIGGMMEVESAAHILKSTENPDVQTLAQIMIKDHGMANSELSAIAKKEKIRLPLGLPKAKLVAKNKMNELTEEFVKNRYYANLMVKEHQEAIALFTKASASEGNAALKAFAAKKLPILKHHLMEAQHLQKLLESIKNDKGDLPLKQSKDRS